MMVAKYQQLANLLRDQIRSGRYPPGSTLPRLIDIAQAEEVNTHTVRAAVTVLEQEGLVKSIRRRGTVVMDWRAVPVQPSIYTEILEPGGTRGPWETACAKAGVNGGMRTVEVAEEEASATVASGLGINLGEAVVRRSRQMLIDGQPVGTSTAWYPAESVRGTALERAEKVVGGSYGALTSIGLRPTTVFDGYSSRPATPDEDAEFRPRTGTVIIHTRVTFDASDRPIEYKVNVADASRYQPGQRVSLEDGRLLP